MGDLAFLPEARSLLTRTASAPAASSPRRRFAIDVELRGDGSPLAGQARVPISIDVLGAGDVIGIDRAMIARVEPAAGVRGFEPNYVPFVEFVDADFPWRYTLDRSPNRPRPWLALLALRSDEFEFVEQGRGPLPRIRVHDAARSLPDPSHLWAHAHVQVRRPPQSTAAFEQLAAADPTAGFSRLLCPRKLSEGVVYRLFLVPTFEAGRLAGLGEQTVPTIWDAPAWSTAATGVTLPVYFQSSFVTSALEDFEMLVRRLTAHRAEDGLGASRQAYAGRPGYYDDYHEHGRTFPVATALRRPGTNGVVDSTDAALADRLARTLTTAITGERVAPDQDGPHVEDPLVAVPPYAWRHRMEKDVQRSRAVAGRWFDRLNLDLRLRQVAGLGAEVVRRNQERFSRVCWEQYDEIVEANRQLTNFGVSELVADRLVTRHFARLPAEVQLQLGGSLLPVVPAGEDGRTVSQHLADLGVPATFTDVRVRRVAATRTVWVSDGGETTTVLPTPALPGDTTVDPRLPRSTRRMRRTAQPTEPTATFRTRAEELLGGADVFAAQPAPTVGVPVGEYASVPLADKVAQLAADLPRVKAQFTVAGLTDDEQEVLAPVYRSPVIAEPLVDQLREVASASLLNGADTMPDNSVSVVEEDRVFVEAFLAGANHEMNHELRWREFPTDMRGTIFRRFWDRGYLAGDERGDDIAPIHTWTKSLGANVAPHDSDRQGNLVLLVRGDIIRKLGTTVIVLNEASGTAWKRGQGTDHAPVFSGHLGRDIAYYGFDVSRTEVLSNRQRWFFVLHEAPGRLRFGLDIATVAARQRALRPSELRLDFPLQTLGRLTTPIAPARPADLSPPAAEPQSWDDLSWEHVALTAGGYLDVQATSVSAGPPAYWSENRTSATIARSLLQKPVAAVLPATRIL